MISKSIGHRNVSKGSQIGVLALSLAVWGSSLMAAEPAVVIKATTNRMTGQTYFDPPVRLYQEGRDGAMGVN